MKIYALNATERLQQKVKTIQCCKDNFYHIYFVNLRTYNVE